ncbi:TetR/AcrR family transcriptional regulator [Halioxenophilus aromaticivorans]|uniref:TetR/AcrR family transcriptional regulator n=1 Tax=Halioxenophilus aromaticivorans TaxID=1306992 RepID=A0AAV3TXZ4_9ALTE
MLKPTSSQPVPDQPSQKKPSQKKPSKADLTKTLILDTAQQLMLGEGYAAVTTRRIAKEAGLKPPTVHYHFKTTDDLLLALFRRNLQLERKRVDSTLTQASGLVELWRAYIDQPQTALAIEFMGLANHREAIRKEITAVTEKERRRRADLLQSLMNDSMSSSEAGISGLGLSVVLIGLARTLVLEQNLGIDVGHADTKQFVEQLLQSLS